MSKDTYKLVTDYSLHTYPCGLSSGDKLKLKVEIKVKDHKGKHTGEIHRKGEIWVVLSGVPEEPEIIWLKQPNGERHTWDASDIFETFKLIKK